MSALGFEVHVDKENATPAPIFNKGVALKGLSQSNKRNLVQQTPRKALYDVNHDPAQVSASRNQGGKDFGSSNNGPKEKLNGHLFKPSSKITSGVENLPQGFHSQKKKSDLKKTPSLQQKEQRKTKDPEFLPPKSKPTNAKKKLPKQVDFLPEPKDEDYDSDTILPKTERLSSYVDKLFSWRPPCLFGSIPDSDCELSEPEDLPEDDMSMCLTEVPPIEDYDLTSLMVDLPPLSPPKNDRRMRDSDCGLEQTPDTSLSLGCLHVMHDSPNPTGMDNQ